MPLAALITPAIGAAVVGGGIKAATSIYGASQANKANKRATEAANQANQANIAANRENRDYIANLNQPKIAGGNAAFDMLLREFGVGQPAPPDCPPAGSQVVQPTSNQPGKAPSASQAFSPANIGRFHQPHGTTVAHERKPVMELERQQAQPSSHPDPRSPIPEPRTPRAA